MINYSKLSQWKYQLKHWGGTSISPTPTRLPTRSLCCQGGRKTWILYYNMLRGTSWRTGNFKFPRQLYAAPKDFSLPLTRGRTKFNWPRRTKSRRSNWHIFNLPLLNDIWKSHPWPWCCFAQRFANIIPPLTGVFGSVTAQHNPIPTSTQIGDDLARTCWLHNTLRGIYSTCRNAIRNSNKLKQHCQAGLWEETSLCGVRAPNKIQHTKQDTTHFLFFDNDTTEADNIFLATCCRTTNQKCPQLEHMQ